MESPSGKSKNKQKIGEKRQRNDTDENSGEDCAPLVRRSLRNRSTKTPAVQHAEVPVKITKQPTRSNVSIGYNVEDGGKFPKIIFSRNEIPPNGRVNIASTPDFICKVKKAIMDTDEWDILMDSSFAKLFQIPTSLAATSGKIIHQFLCRMLVTMKKHELWIVFGGKPLRFGLTEFANVTGLHCGPLPHPDEVDKLKKRPDGEDSNWDKLLSPLFGKKRQMHVREISELLVAESTSPNGRYLSGDVRLALSLLVLIDRVINPTSSVALVREETVEMLRDLDSVLSYPWGRESFENTLRMLILGDDYQTVEELRERLAMQTHMSVHGFPLAIQLTAFKAVPKLHSLLPKNKQLTDLMCPEVDTVGFLRNIRTAGIIRIEDSEDLLVHPYIEFGFDLVNNDLSWDDEIQDLSVDNVVEHISQGFKFLPEHWQVWGQRALINPSPRKKVAGNAKTKKLTHTEDTGTYKIQKEAPTESYVREDITNVLSINWGKPDKAVPSLMKWLEDEKARDLADRARWWTMFGDRIISSYCSYHGEKDYGKGVESTDKGGKEEAVATETKSIPTGVEDESRKQTVDSSIQSEDDVDWERLEKELEAGRSKSTGQLTNSAAMDISQTNLVDPTESVRNSPPGDMDIDIQTDVIPSPNKGSQTKQPTREDVDSEGNSLSVRVTEKVDDTNGGQSNCPKASEREHQDEMVAVIGSNVLHSGLGVNVSEERAGGEAEGDIIDQRLTRRDDNIDEDIIAADKQDELSPVEGTDMGADVDTREDYLLDNPLESEDCREEPGGDGFDSSPKQPTSYQDESEQTEGNEQKKADNKKKQRRRKNKLLEKTSRKKIGGKQSELNKSFLSILKHEDGSVYTVNNLEVTKKFFEQLYTPSNHISNEHIEAVLSVIWNRHSESLLKDRVGILDTLFTAKVVEDYKHFRKLRSGHDKFAWNRVIQRYVKGDVDGRGLGLAWVVDIDEVYMPMYWQKHHWVAICINLRTGWVHVMDPNMNLTKEEKVKEAMQPLLSSLPHILRAYVDKDKCNYDIPGEFFCERIPEVPQNDRSGDCGLLSVKFIEQLSQNLTLDGMDDDAVDKMRMSYAIQVFECFVKPLGS